MPTPNASLPPRPSPIAVGEAAPDFVLPDQNRAEWRLSDHVKKGDVVLAFFPFAFTGVCGVENKCISEDLTRWSGKATVVGISCDSMFSNKQWAQAEGYKHTLLSDLHREVCKGYGLYWADMNVASRGTVVIGRAADGKGKVKFVEARPPSQAMNWETVLSKI